MRIPLRQKLGERGQRTDGGECGLVVEDPRGVRLEKLDIIAAEVVGEPRAPGNAQAIAELH